MKQYFPLKGGVLTRAQRRLKGGTVSNGLPGNQTVDVSSQDASGKLCCITTSVLDLVSQDFSSSQTAQLRGPRQVKYHLGRSLVSYKLKKLEKKVSANMKWFSVTFSVTFRDTFRDIP